MSTPARDIQKPRSAAVIYPSQVFVGATLIILGPLLDPILRDLHIPLAQAGLLSFGFFLGRVAGVLLLNFGLIVSMAVSHTPRPELMARGGEDEFPRLNERWSYGKGRVKAVRIAVEGAIFRERIDGLFSSSRYDKVEDILRQIRAAQADDTVRAIILEVDSPGGAVTPSDEIYRALNEFKASTTTCPWPPTASSPSPPRWSAPSASSWRPTTSRS